MEMNAQMTVVGDATSFLSPERKQHSVQMFTQWRGTKCPGKEILVAEKRGSNIQSRFSTRSSKAGATTNRNL